MTRLTSHQAERRQNRKQIQHTQTRIRLSIMDKHLPVIIDAPEAGKDVSEAGVAVKFGLTLGALYRALQPSTQKALTERHRGSQ